ncbi:AAA domain-containing protein, partial [Acinetobacter baumannii]
KAIVNIAGWEVKAEAAIGQFSFSKYLMWLDLSSRMDQLKNQSVVNHLIESPREPFIKQDEFPQPAQLDQQYKPQQLFTPLSSDSSQLAAVMSAALGRTFVLSGPPGTGKSQTITNMISQCLADGKSVLFVSEKMAALEVVYRRLTQIGLSELCLQLHSSKSQKMEVLDQLRERAQKNNDPYFLSAQPKTTEWQKLSDRLIQTRDELNQHVKNLHTSHAIGWSLYAAMSDELRYRDTPHLRFPDISIAALTAEKRELMSETVTQAVSLRQLVNENAKDVLNGFAEGLAEPIWSLAWQEQYQMLQDQLVEQIQRLQNSVSTWQEVFGFDVKQNLSQVKNDISIFKALSDLVQQTDLKLLSVVKDLNLGTITQAKQIVQDLRQQRSSLVGQYQSQIYQADLNQIAFKWREAESKIFPFSWFAKFQLRNLVKTYQSSTQRPTALAVAHDLPILQHIQSQQRQFTECENQLASKLGPYWQGEDSTWQIFEAMHNQWQEIKQIVASTITDQATLLKAVEFSKNNNLDGIKQNITQVENTFSQLLNDHVLKNDAQLTPYSDINFTEILERQQQLQQHSSSWRHWLNWQAIKSQLVKQGLKPLAFELFDTPLELDAALKRLNINLARHWITHQFSQHPELNQFNSQQHEQKIQTFAQQDKDHQLAASHEIIHRWNTIFSEQDKYKAQWTVLNKELGKKRRHIPVRELMRQIPDVLVGLKPCLLMSPLSVAQYLDTEAKFDVVIFDEASQIPVWDAIGALARGKQSIVVGDNKQMPPTSFFGKGDSEEEVDEEVTEDLESILDECLAAQLPELALNWHYRSRYESLIQFSNQKYYKGGLFTFPAPVAKDTAVKLHVVEGVYDKGDTRTNSNEAKAIVEFIIQHLQSQLGQENSLTLGVVTFNMTQQKLIEDLLDNELANHPELETLSKSGIEPLFIKNLENVQGDERDIIVFSITYAKDQDGRLSMNFGALNRQGGQRRLNVAITRARQGLHVFSALSPEEINLARTNSEGVRDLKDFLVFARSGQLHLNYADQSKHQTKKEFVQYLQAKLQEQGWSVDLGIGQGDSCVDIAIKDDLNSGNYIAGIIVDGENYAKAATARDRDQLRPTVLNGLGWEVLSVWTVDWWLDPEQNLTKLVNVLEEIKSKKEVA